MRLKPTTDTYEAILAMRDAGRPIREIVDTLGCSYTLVESVISFERRTRTGQPIPMSCTKAYPRVYSWALERSGKGQDPQLNLRSRFSLLRRLTAAALADYLAQELEDGVPVSWYDWLAEEV